MEDTQQNFHVHEVKLVTTWKFQDLRETGVVTKTVVDYYHPRDIVDRRRKEEVGLLVDSEIVLSTRYGKTMVFINKNLINRDRLSTRPYQPRPLINKVDSW